MTRMSPRLGLSIRDAAPEQAGAKRRVLRPFRQYFSVCMIFVFGRKKRSRWGSQSLALSWREFDRQSFGAP